MKHLQVARLSAALGWLSAGLVAPNGWMTAASVMTSGLWFAVMFADLKERP